MEVRFNTVNEDVEEVLKFIDKHSRKYFIETAVLYYLKHLKENKNIIDVCLDINKFENRKTETKKKTSKKAAPKKETIEDKVEIESSSYNSFEDMANEGW